ncbi:hypothetical protein [Streptomyces sp. NPDC051677]|uniref:hypothetical protein n=1 Tax=Streptomyces sp. NPDC051677 TaxID=3365669 RepID=UPI0037D7B369
MTQVIITVPGSEILPGDLLAAKDWRTVEEIGLRTGDTTSLYILDGGIYIVGDGREYVVRREMPAPERVLVVGPTDIPADVERLRDVARDVAYELGRPATYATHTDYDVTAFAAVYSVRPLTSLRTAPALVLVAEAMLAGVEVHEPLKADEVTTCGCGLVSRHTRPHVDERGIVWCAECLSDDACAHCGEAFDMEDAEFVQRDDTWFPIHAGCLAPGHRPTSSRLMNVASLAVSA